MWHAVVTLGYLRLEGSSVAFRFDSAGHGYRNVDIWAACTLACMAQREFSTSATTNIGRPARSVFALISDPNRLIQLSPGTRLIGDVEKLSAGGFRVRASSPSRLARYQVRMVTELCDPPNRIVIKSELSERGVVAKLLRLRIADRVEWALAPEGENCSRVTLTVSWQKLSATSGRLFGPRARRTAEEQLRLLEQLATTAR